jgi:mannose-1-phosphate guanylyltransferase
MEIGKEVIKDPIFYAHVLYCPTRWGGYDTIQHYRRKEGFETKLKRLFIEPYQNISYQKHEYRGENWSVIDGSGTLVINGDFYELTTGSAINIPIGAWHSIKAGDEGIEIVEVQAGQKCREDDIIRKYYDWSDILRFAGGEE